MPDAASDRFRQAVAGAARLLVKFRFQPGSMELDSRGLRDLDLLVSCLRSQRVDPGRVILAGFADDSGTPAANHAVAQRRAEAVAAVLARSSIVPGKAVAFGAELPVADNAMPEGRERNRRVEVYVAPYPAANRGCGRQGRLRTRQDGLTARTPAAGPAPPAPDWPRIPPGGQGWSPQRGSAAGNRRDRPTI